MGIWDAILLGIIQGLTEFLPVSSSGHLAVAQSLLNYKAEKHLLFDVMVHVGTLGAVVWVYRSSLWAFVDGSWAALTGRGSEKGFKERLTESEPVREILWILVATVPTGLIGILFRKQLKAALGSLTMIACLFCVTGVLLIATIWYSSGKRSIAEMGLWMALLIGVAQGIAILPGISRSGATIACALLVGMRRDEAARFSFLLSIPAICGATLLEMKDITSLDTNLTPLLIGALASAIVGYFALRFLIQLVQKGRLAWFAIYLWTIAAALLLKVHVFT